MRGERHLLIFVAEYDDPRELIQKVSLLAAKKKEEKSVKPAQPTKEAAPASKLFSGIF